MSGCTKCLSGHYKAKSSFVEFTNPFILQPSSFCRKTVFLKNWTDSILSDETRKGNLASYRKKNLTLNRLKKELWPFVEWMSVWECKDLIFHFNKLRSISFYEIKDMIWYSVKRWLIQYYLKRDLFKAWQIT